MTDSDRAIEYTNKDYASLREALLELAGERLPEWTDHSENDPGVMLVELFAAMGDAVLHYQDRLANESYLETATERRSVLHLLRLIGYELRPAVPASASLRLRFAADATDPVTIDTGTMFETDADATGEPIGFQYIDDPLTIDVAALPIVEADDGTPFRVYGSAPDTASEPDPGLPVVQVDNAFTDQVLGSSDGSAGQRFAIPNSPLITDSLTVRVDEGGGPRAWTRVGTLFDSGPDDRHYRVRRDEDGGAWVEFGGRYGRAPGRGRNNITADYRVGGGARGNVPPHTITELVTEVPGLEEVDNPAPATGGEDPEPIAEAAARAPDQFRSMGRAVTARDYESHALAFGVGKARARAAAWNHIELYVAPAGGGFPTDTLKEDLRAYFDAKRIMTSILVFRDPVYVPIEIAGELDVDAYYFTDRVRQRAENAVRTLLDFDAVDFADRLYLSKVYEAIEAIEGVKGINISVFREEGAAEAIPETGRIELGWNQIPKAAHPRGIELTRVSGGQNDG